MRTRVWIPLAHMELGMGEHLFETGYPVDLAGLEVSCGTGYGYKLLIVLLLLPMG